MSYTTPTEKEKAKSPSSVMEESEDEVHDGLSGDQVRPSARSREPPCGVEPP